MKNNDTEELKPVYICEASYSPEDEISIIDLALVLIRRKVLIAAIFIAFITLGVTIALFTPKTYTYSSTIIIGSQIIGSSIRLFESPQALLAKIQNIYAPRALSKHKKSYPNDKNKYQIKSNVPADGNITTLEIKNTADLEDTSKELLKLIIQQIIQDHNGIFQSVKQNIETRLKQANNNLKALKISRNNETESATYQNIIESLSIQMANLRETTVVLPVIKSQEPTGVSRKVTVIVSAFTGLFLGLFSAFLLNLFRR